MCARKCQTLFDKCLNRVIAFTANGYIFFHFAATVKICQSLCLTAKFVCLFTANGYPHWNPHDIFIYHEGFVFVLFCFRLVRKFIHSLLSLDPDPSHAERLRATASLSKPETDFSLSYKDNKLLPTRTLKVVLTNLVLVQFWIIVVLFSMDVVEGMKEA